MNEKVTLKNDSPVDQTVAGYGDVAAGGTLAVSDRVANHLLRSGLWVEVKPAKKAKAAAGAEEKSNDS